MNVLLLEFTEFTAHCSTLALTKVSGKKGHCVGELYYVKQRPSGKKMWKPKLQCLIQLTDQNSNIKSG